MSRSLPGLDEGDLVFIRQKERRMDPDPVEPISVEMGSWLGSLSRADEAGFFFGNLGNLGS